MDLPGQLRVGSELQLLFVEVVIRLGLLECRLPILADHDNVDRKIASSDTINVSVGHGLDSMNNIQTVNSAM